MTDAPELNVWRGASDAANNPIGCDLPACRNCTDAATVIRSYGDQRDAEGYAQAVADVVAWLRNEANFCRTQGVILTAHEITRRFGKGQDHG